MRPAVRRATLGVIFLTIAAPLVPLLFWSFSNRWFYPDMWPQAWGLRAWGHLFNTSGSQVLNAAASSVGVALATAAISVLLGIFCGRALGLYDFRGKDAISILLVLPVIVPPLCVSMGLHLWFIRLALADTFFGVVLVHLTFCIPYAIFVMWGVFSNYNPDYEDQARSLGGSALAVFTRVTLPMIFPGVAVAGLFSFLLSWSQYISTLIIGGGEVITLPILLFALMGSGDRPVAAAVSLVFVLPALGALLLSARYLGGRGTAGAH